MKITQSNSTLTPKDEITLFLGDLLARYELLLKRKTTLTIIEFDSEEIKTLDRICRIMRCVTDRTPDHEKVNIFLDTHVTQDDRIKIEEFIMRIFNI